MKAILDRDYEINEKINELLNKQDGKIKRKIIKDSKSETGKESGKDFKSGSGSVYRSGYISESRSQYAGLEYFKYEKVLEFQRNFLSKKIFNEILNPDKTNDDPFDIDLKLGKSDWRNKKLENYFDYLDDIFKGINIQLNGVNYILNEKREKNFNKLSSFEINCINKIIERRTNRILNILRKYLKIGNSQKLFLRLGTSIGAIMDVSND